MSDKSKIEWTDATWNPTLSAQKGYSEEELKEELKGTGYLNLAKVPPSVRLLSPSNRSDLRDVRRREKAVMQSVSMRIIGDT